MEGLITHGQDFVGRQELLALPTPESTATHKVVPHATIVQLLIESLALRGLEVVKDQYAVTEDGMRMFGVLEINREESGVRFLIGCRNSNDKTFSLGLTVGFRVFVCSNLAFHGEFTPITRKHTRNFDPLEVIDYGVTKMQRHFEPMKRQIDVWHNHKLPDAEAKAILCDAFVGGKLDVPRKLAPHVYDAYFNPRYEEFNPRNMWALQNAFTGVFKEHLEPIPMFKATATLGEYFAAVS